MQQICMCTCVNTTQLALCVCVRVALCVCVFQCVQVPVCVCVRVCMPCIIFYSLRGSSQSWKEQVNLQSDRCPAEQTAKKKEHTK